MRISFYRSGALSEAIARARNAKASMYRTLVLEAAEHLFAIRGYERTKIQHIAAASGVSLGTLYSVFDGKAAILEAIHFDRLAELFMLVDETMASGESAATRLLRGNRIFIRWLTQHPDFLRLHLDSSAWASDPHGVTEGQVNAWRRGIDLIASVLGAAMREGDAYDSDPVVAARLMVAMQQVFMSDWFQSGMNESADDLAERIEIHIRRSLFRSTP